MPQTLAISRSGHFYFCCVIAAGSCVLLLSGVDLYWSPVPSEWLVLAALTLLTGSFTVKIPTVSARLSVSDAFVFASVLLFGPSAATIIAALDSLVVTVWVRAGKRSRLQSLFNVSAVTLAIWFASVTFYRLAGVPPNSSDLVLTRLLGPLFVLAALYFLVNSWLVAIALAFERNANPWKMWWENFPWFSLNYFGAVSVAALLVSYTRSVDLTAVSIILPLLIISYFTYRSSLGRIEDAQQHLAQVNELYMSTIETLAMAVDAKDQITHGHIRRVQVYTVELAKRLGVADERELKAIAAAALLHDMGKLAIPEHILNKPGKLTSAEFDKMKRHADIGADLLSSIKFPYPVVPIVRHHHEHWDGRGYPAGISGTDIPLGARILSVVDCFDALTSDRPYRPRLNAEDAFDILRERRGTMYDPLVVDTFVRAYPEIAPAAIHAGQEAKSIFPMEGQFADSANVNRPLKQIRANATEAALLTECAQSINRAKSITDAFADASQCLRQLIPATVFALYRYRSDADALVCEQCVGDSGKLLHGLSIKIGQRITGWCGATRRTSVNSDAALDLAQIAEMFQPMLRSTLSVPLSQGDRLLGVLTAYSSRENAFNEAHSYIVEQATSSLSEKIAELLALPASVVSFSARNQKSSS